MKTKTPLIIAISSGLTLALVLAVIAAMGFFRERHDDRASRVEETPNQIIQPSPEKIVASPTPAQSSLTQNENDYLYDLSQALQPQERDRTNAAEKLAIAQKIRAWLEAGADYWEIREKFDAAYKGTVLDSYPHNRDVYIKFATERFANNYRDTLTPPPQIPAPAPGGNSSGGSDSGNSFIGGNPIPQQAAVVTSDQLNCRDIPESGTPRLVLQSQAAIEVNRIDYSTGKAWYLTTQGCWVSGNYIQLKPQETPPTIPADYREAYVIATVGFYKDAPDLTANNAGAPYKATDKIVVSKYPTGDPDRVNNGIDWYRTLDGKWINGNDFQ